MVPPERQALQKGEDGRDARGILPKVRRGAWRHVLVFVAGLVTGGIAWPAASLVYVTWFPGRNYADQVAFYHRRYSASEGPKNRGSNFFSLCLALGFCAQSGEDLSEERARGYLGVPDTVTESGREKILAYQYDKQEGGRNFVFVVFREGRLRYVGYGEGNLGSFAPDKP
jgi:hypothetical protein